LLAPILKGLDWSLIFHTSTDAYDTTMGVVLGQKGDLLTYIIYFINKNLTPSEINYTVTENEMLEVFHAMNKF
jgi:hypothetical protein